LGRLERKVTDRQHLVILPAAQENDIKLAVDVSDRSTFGPGINLVCTIGSAQVDIELRDTIAGGRTQISLTSGGVYAVANFALKFGSAISMTYLAFKKRRMHMHTPQII